MNVQGIVCGGVYCHNEVRKAVQSGDLLSANCFACADCRLPASEYDHRDYNRPLKVQPVCRACNIRRGAAIPKRWTRIGLLAAFSRCRTFQPMHLRAVVDALAKIND